MQLFKECLAFYCKIEKKKKKDYNNMLSNVELGTTSSPKATFK